MRHARYWLFLYTKLLWILADVGDGLICSLCSGFVKKNMNSYYCVRHTMHIKNTKPTTSTQSETESIFLYLLIQMLLNLVQYTDKNFPNKTRS
ncbi:hypothetical protein ECB96_05810 [Helicobacter pylori]|nr:hypothetical protein ECB96_05810 [Helicobacter pylori]